MNTVSKIWVLVAVVLLSSIACWADGGVGDAPSERHPAQSGHSAAAYPANKADLFSALPPGESGISFPERLPQLNSAENLHPQGDSYLLANLEIQRYTKIGLRFFQATYQHSIVKKLIFPFHSHW